MPAFGQKQTFAAHQPTSDRHNVPIGIIFAVSLRKSSLSPQCWHSYSRTNVVPSSESCVLVLASHISFRQRGHAVHPCRICGAGHMSFLIRDTEEVICSISNYATLDRTFQFHVQWRPIMFQYWQEYFRLLQIAWDANAVVAMRMMRLASGGALAQREMQRMVAEKGLAMTEAQFSAATRIMMGAGIAGATKSASDVYRRKVRANRRRLGSS